MNRNIVETITGAVVVIIAILFVAFAHDTVKIINKPSETYKIEAKFENSDGIMVGSDVRIGGIKIGVVSNQWLESQSYLANIEMTIDDDVKLPKDSSAQILSSGLLGSKYVSLVPGADDRLLENRDQIKFTQSSVNIENLIGKFMFSGAGK